jgi:hypothetical protein
MITGIFSFGGQCEFYSWSKRYCVLLIFSHRVFEEIIYLKTVDRWSNEVGIDQGGVLENIPCDLIPRDATLRSVSSLCIYMYTFYEINTTVTFSLHFRVSFLLCSNTNNVSLDLGVCSLCACRNAKCPLCQARTKLMGLFYLVVTLVGLSDAQNSRARQEKFSAAAQKATANTLPSDLWY